jgi:hypothetical protein
MKLLLARSEAHPQWSSPTCARTVDPVSEDWRGPATLLNSFLL